VTPEEPRAAAVRLQVPAEAKLIGGKTIRFLGLTSGGHESASSWKKPEQASPSLMKRSTSGSLPRLS
jgi:hypothetical protein